MTPLSFGLVGAGPWAKRYHAPLLATGPETTLTAVWARNYDSAAALAARYGATAAGSLEQLLDSVDAVAFAVPPPVQAALALTAARAGKHLLIEKPIGFDLASARRFADDLSASGAVHMLMLTNRFSAVNEAFLADARALNPQGGLAVMVGGAILPGAEFATPWRRQRGVLVDNGPHMFDLAESAFGPVASVTATGDPMRWISAITRHEGGAVVSLSLSLTVGIEGFDFRVQAFGHDGAAAITQHFDHAPDAEVARNIRRQFVGAVAAGRPHRLDVRRGLLLQSLVDAAERSIAAGGVPTTPEKV